MKTKSIFLLMIALILSMALFSCDQLTGLIPGQQPEHEHTWVEASCETAKTCSTCNATEGDPLGHTEEILEAKASTCTEAGLTEGKKCSVCDKILIAQEEIPVKAHTEEVTLGRPASCTEAGLTEGKKCSVCDEILVAQEEIAPEGHKEEILPGRDSTCTKVGLTEGKKCSVCGETLVAQEELALADHTEEIVNSKAPTCTEAGLTEGKKCSVCGETLVAQEEIPAAHTEETIEGKNPNCTETGLTEGKKCSVCGKILVAQEEIPSLGHKDENADFECDVCKEDLCTSHTPAEPIVENKKEATCQQAGSYDSVVKCSICGDEISRETKAIEKLSHTEETLVGKAASCTETGLTEGKKCSVCGETLVAQEEIGLLPHTEEVVAGKDPGCKEPGLTEGKKCSVCGETLVAQEEIPVLSHTEEAVAGVAASCTASGLTDGKKCSVCGETLVAQETIPALGHNWDSGVTVMNVTTYSCTACGLQKATSTALENVENIFTGKQFVGTEESIAQVLVASWFAGGGYEVLTDGQKDQEQVGRFSTKLNSSTAFADGSIDLGEKYVLGTLRFYLYDTKDSITEADKKESIGKDMLIQVYIDGNWYDVVNCLDNSALCNYLVINEGFNNDYLEFDLSGIVAQKIRFYISASISKNGISYQEIECNGALLNEHIHTEEILAGKAATCLNNGVTEGKKCSVCGETLVAQEIIPALDHAWGEETSADGITTCTCGNCGLTKATADSLESSDNLLTGKVFTPTDAALAQVLSASWWKGSGYNGLTDGIKNADNATGRFSTAMNASAFMDATIDLGGKQILGTLRFYIYEVSARTEDQIKSSIGSDILIQVYSDGEWHDVVYCANNEALYAKLVSIEGLNNDYLEFDLTGIVAEKVRFFISASASASGTSFQEVECSGKVIPSDEPVYVENVFAAKQFVPTEEATASILAASWWKGSGYEGLTDGIKNADNAVGRFATIMSTNGMMDATIDLGGTYELHSLKFYTYDPAAGTGAGSLGSNLLIQVYVDGEWKDVVTCADNATLASYLVVNEGTFNDYLEFDLGGISAEKVRFYISASASSSGTSYEEIECSGYTK